MFCNKCGKELVDGAAFCTYCGAAVAAPVQPETPAYEAPVEETPVAEAPVVETPAYEVPAYEAPAYTAPAQQYSAPQQYTAPQQFATAQYTAPVEGNPEAGGALAFGIVSICLCFWPVTSIIGIIMGAIGIKKSGRAVWYANHGGGKKAMSIVSRVLSICGMACGIFFTVLYLLLLIE